MPIFKEAESDDDLQPGQQEVLNALRRLKEYDVMRFSSATDGLTYPGQVISIESNANGDVSTILIKHMDKKHKDVNYEYQCPEGFHWISRENVETPSILNFQDLKPRMCIRTTAACGGEILG